MQEQTFRFSSISNVGVDLVEIETDIVTLTSRLQGSDLSIYDRREIAQSVRIKLAGALPGKDIHNLAGYLRRTVRNEMLSFLRQHRSFTPLLMTDEGEPYSGRLLISLSEGMDDPQIVYEQRTAFEEMLEKVVDAILALPPMQRLSMVCSLHEELDDPTTFDEAFRRRGLDVAQIRWPREKAAKQRLQASCRPARFAMARHMGIDLSAYRWLCGPKTRESRGMHTRSK